MCSLSTIDFILEETALKLNASLTKDDDKGMWFPESFEERSIKWNREGIHYVIQIFPEIENGAITSWSFWIAASQDVDDVRYMFDKKLVAHGRKTDIINDIFALLSEAIEIVAPIRFKDLTPGADLKKRKLL